MCICCVCSCFIVVSFFVCLLCLFVVVCVGVVFKSVDLRVLVFVCVGWCLLSLALLFCGCYDLLNYRFVCFAFAKTKTYVVGL